MSHKQYTLPQEIYFFNLETIANIRFTSREIEIISCLCETRMRVKEIASFLFMAPKTVGTHITNIQGKIDCNTRETILEYVRKSGSYNYIKEHYQALRIRQCFEQQLNQINHKSQCQEYIFIEWVNDDNISNNKLQKHIKNQIKEHLRILQINIKNETKNRSELNQFKDYIHHPYIHVMSKSLWDSVDINDKDNLFDTYNITNIEHSNPILLIIRNKKAIPLSLPDISSTYKTTDYYFAILEILNNSSVEIDINKIHLTLNEQNNMISHNSEHITLPNFTHLRHFRNISHIQKPLLLALCFIFGVLLATIIYQILQSKNDSALEKSDRWNLPFFSDDYIERIKLTEKIWEEFKDLNKPKIIGLSGLGGVGKTYLAIQCIHFPRQPYKFRAWFNAETESSLKSNYFELGEKEHLFHPNMSDKQKIREVKDWLEKKENIMLIYDNAPNMSEIYNYLPQNAHIIITSKSPEIPKIVEIDIMTDQESLDLLKKLLPKDVVQSEDFKQCAIKLVKELNNIPLALCQAAAYISENSITISYYLNLYKTERKNLLSKEIMSSTNKNEAIYVTWDLALDAMKTSDNYAQIADLLNLISFCSPKNIPKKMLTHCLFNENSSKSNININKLISILRKYSLIKINTYTISIHPLVSDWVHEKIKDSEKINYINQLIKSIHLLYPKNTNSIEDEFCKETSDLEQNAINLMIPHLESVLLKSKEYIKDESHIKLVSICADAYKSVGDMDKSKILLENLLLLKQSNYKENHPELSVTFKNISYIYNIIGDFYKSESYLEKALSINEKSYGINNEKNIDMLELLSRIHYAAGNWEKCLTVLERSMLIIEKYYNGDHPSAVKIFYWYARANLLMGQLNKSKAFLYKSLEVARKYYGENHAELGSILRMMGWIDFLLGDNKGKEKIENSLKVLLTNFHPNHPEVVLSYISLAHVNYELGELNSSQEYFQKSLDVRKKYNGAKSIWTAFSMAGLGLLKASHGLKEESMILLASATNIINENYDKTPLWCSIVLHTIGLGYFNINEIEKCKEALTKSIRTILDKYGENHIYYAIVSANLGNLDRLLNDTAKSKQSISNSLKIINKTYGSDHITTAKLKVNLALASNDNFKENRQLLDDALIIFKKYYGENHKNTKNLADLAKSSHIFGEEKKGFMILLPF